MKKQKRQESRKNKRGSALLLVLFILTSVLVVSVGGSTVIIAAIKASGVQSESTKAYFAAEAGAERILYEVRKNQSINLTVANRDNVISGVLPDGSSYSVDYTTKLPKITFTSIGTFERTRRSVEVSF